MSRQRTLLSNEHGDYLAQNIVGAIVSLLVMGMVTAAIVGVTHFQKQLGLQSSVTNQASLTDSALRSDSMWATSVKITDAKSFTVTVSGGDNQCRTSQWDITTAGGATKVTNTIVNYPSTDATSSPATCSGTPVPSSTDTLIDDASPTTTFTYKNRGGRSLEFNAGALSTAAATEAPVGITSASWKAEQPSSVSLGTRVAHTGIMAADYQFNVLMPHLEAPKPPPANPATSHFVAPGSLE